VKQASPDPYCYPGTHILRNLKDIRDSTALEAFEAAMVAIRLVRLSEGPLHGPFDLHRLCETHRRIFDGVYDWAGQLRRNTGTMTKQREAGNVISYGDSVYVEPALSKVFAELAWEMQLKGLPANRFALRAAFYYGEIDAIHPFREGNSRTLRKFFGDLAEEAGYKIDWTSASRTEEQRRQIFLARDLAVMRGDPSLLASIIAHHLHSV